MKPSPYRETTSIRAQSFRVWRAARPAMSANEARVPGSLTAAADETASREVAPQPPECVHREVDAEVAEVDLG